MLKATKNGLWKICVLKLIFVIVMRLQVLLENE